MLTLGQIQQHRRAGSGHGR